MYGMLDDTFCLDPVLTNILFVRRNSRLGFLEGGHKISCFTCDTCMQRQLSLTSTKWQHFILIFHFQLTACCRYILSMNTQDSSNFGLVHWRCSLITIVQYHRQTGSLHKNLTWRVGYFQLLCQCVANARKKTRLHIWTPQLGKWLMMHELL